MVAERVRVAARAVLNAVQLTPDLPVTLDDAVRQATGQAEALAQAAQQLRACGQAQETAIDAAFPQAVAAHDARGHLRGLASVNRAAWDWFQTQAGSSPEVAAAELPKHAWPIEDGFVTVLSDVPGGRVVAFRSPD
mgnify:CR=1 FL=1